MAGMDPVSGEITARRSQEQLLRLAVGSTRDHVVITDVAGKILYINQACLERHGYREAEVIGHHVSILQSPNNPDGYCRTVHEATLRGNWSGEMLDITKKGREFPIFLTSTLIHDERGNAVAAVGISREITETKKSENALRSTQEFLVSLLENTPAPIFVVSADERLLLVNGAWEDLMNRRREEVLGCTIQDVFPQEAASFREMNRRVFATNGPVVAEEIVRCPDGLHTFHVVKFPLRDSAGNVTALAGVAVDFTERKRAELALRESEERYRNLFEMCPDAVVVHDGDRFLYINPAGARLYGAANPEELVGRPIMDGVPPEHRDLVRERCRSVIEEGKTAPPAEVKLVRLDGSVIDVEVSCAPLNLQGRRAMHTVMRDISARKNAGQLSPAISQELADLLTHILGYAEWLVHRLPADDKRDRDRACAQRIVDSVARAQELVRVPGETAPPSTGNGPVPATVLLVEDEELTRDFARQTLEAGGYRVLTACNGQEGLELYRANAASISLVLTDVIMPQMAGDLMVAEIRKLSPTVPVLVVTGHVRGAAAERLRAFSVGAFIEKPFTAAALLQQVQQTLGQRVVS